MTDPDTQEFKRTDTFWKKYADAKKLRSPNTFESGLVWGFINGLIFGIPAMAFWDSDPLFTAIAGPLVFAPVFYFWGKAHGIGTVLGFGVGIVIFLFVL